MSPNLPEVIYFFKLPSGGKKVKKGATCGVHWEQKEDGDESNESHRY